MQWIRTFVCAAWRSESCEGPNHAHHVENGGVGLKCSDFLTVPICAAHHAELHRAGKKTFEEAHGVDLKAEAIKLARVSPHRHQGYMP